MSLIYASAIAPKQISLLSNALTAASTGLAIPCAASMRYLHSLEAQQTNAGLTVEARLDQRIYRKGRNVTERELAKLALSAHSVCPRWNYTIAPRPALH
jgi:Rhodopirellula transposase DDE domain